MARKSEPPLQPSAPERDFQFELEDRASAIHALGIMAAMVIGTGDDHSDIETGVVVLFEDQQRALMELRCQIREITRNGGSK
jgi:hypothetical protein